MEFIVEFVVGGGIAVRSKCGLGLEMVDTIRRETGINFPLKDIHIIKSPIRRIRASLSYEQAALSGRFESDSHFQVIVGSDLFASFIKMKYKPYKHIKKIFGVPVALKTSVRVSESIDEADIIKAWIAANSPKIWTSQK